MENFPKPNIGQKVQENIKPETKQYRDGLAEDLKTLRNIDPEVAQDFSIKKQKTEAYEAAAKDVQLQRNLFIETGDNSRLSSLEKNLNSNYEYKESVEFLNKIGGEREKLYGDILSNFTEMFQELTKDSPDKNLVYEKWSNHLQNTPFNVSIEAFLKRIYPKFLKYTENFNGDFTAKDAAAIEINKNKHAQYVLFLNELRSDTNLKKNEDIDVYSSSGLLHNNEDKLMSYKEVSDYFDAKIHLYGGTYSQSGLEFTSNHVNFKTKLSPEMFKPSDSKEIFMYFQKHGIMTYSESVFPNVYNELSKEDIIQLQKWHQEPDRKYH